MKCREIIVSNDQSAYQIIKRLKEQGELENAWLIMSNDVNQKMKKEENSEVYVRQQVSLKFFRAIEVRHYKTALSVDSIRFSSCEEPEKIIFMKMKS